MFMEQKKNEEVIENLTNYFSSVKLNSFKVEFFGWLIESDRESLDSFSLHANSFTWISPASSYIERGGKFHGIVSNETIKIARENGVLIVPLVANSGFDREVVHEILSSEPVKESVISSLVSFVVNGNYDGINIDFENIDPNDRENLTSFMETLSKELHRYGKIVSIDVPAKTYDAREGWSGAYDYKSLGEACDYIVLMVYDYHWSGSEPGPVSPLNWLDNVLKYTTSVVKKEKIIVGIPFYGYDWYGGRGKGITFSNAINLILNLKAKVYFDTNSGEYYAREGGHEIWFQGAKSTELRLNIIVNKYNITKVAAWRVGAEDPRTWEVIKK